MRVKNNAGQNEISSFVGAYAYLSPFNKKPVTHEGFRYPSIIHAYVMGLVENNLPVRRVLEGNMQLPPKRFYKNYLDSMKTLGEIDLTSINVKTAVMESILKAYFSQHINFARYLMGTRNKQIFYADDDAIDRDVFGVRRTGDSGYVGLNAYGKLLMQLRGELRSGELRLVGEAPAFEDESLKPITDFSINSPYYFLSNSYPIALYQNTAGGVRTFESVAQFQEEFNADVRDSINDYNQRMQTWMEAKLEKDKANLIHYSGRELQSKLHALKLRYADEFAELMGLTSTTIVDQAQAMRYQFLREMINQKFENPMIKSNLMAIGKQPIKANADLDALSLSFINEIRRLHLSQAPQKGKRRAIKSAYRVDGDMGAEDVFDFVDSLTETGKLSIFDIRPPNIALEDKETKLLDYIRVLRELKTKYSMPVDIKPVMVRPSDYAEAHLIDVSAQPDIEDITDRISKYNPRRRRQERAPRKPRPARRERDAY